MKNHYLTLEIEIKATPDQIKKAYRLKAVKYHPDKHFGDKYLTERFIEVKDAYDILSEPEKRRIYDLEYKAYFTKEEPQRQQKVREEKRKKTEKEEQFFYNPHKSFYSYQDRKVNETPQFEPTIDHFGDKLPDNIEFFKLPKNIGKIISGYSTLTKDNHPSTNKDRTRRFLKAIAISVAISLVVIFLFRVENPIWITIWSIVPLGISLLIASVANEFTHISHFIGVNGFAYYRCDKNRVNITQSYEVNFNNVTDFLKVIVVNKRNFNYAGTDYTFVWLKNNTILKEENGSHDSKEGEPGKNHSQYWLHEMAERYWTIYLLDNMEKELETKGYLTFNVYGYKNDNYVKMPYINLGIGYIKFITSKGDVTYNFNEIKRVYTKGSNLFLEHSNYEKKFFFFESGDKNGIPLTSLSNRQFFFRAMELLIGYKL